MPDLSEWDSDPLGSSVATLPWSGIGTANPFYSFVGATIVPITSTEFLFTEYNFVIGWQYQINVSLTRVDDEVMQQNPRTLAIVIKDDLNNILIDDSFPISVGSASVSFPFTAESGFSIVGIRFVSGSDRTITIDSVSMDITPIGIDTDLVISEPDGWDGAKLKLQRDSVFHSLVEFFEGTFIFYGSNGEVDGGYDTIVRWEREGGPDAEVRISIEFDSYDDANWVTLFDGQFDLSLLIDSTNRTIRLPIIRDDLWSNFMNRRNTPVDVISDRDLDDEEIEQPVSDVTIELPSQKVTYYGEYNWLDTFTYYETEDIDDFAIIAQLDWEETIADDLHKFTLPRTLIVIGDSELWDLVTGIFEAPWDGEYVFDVRIVSAYYDPDTSLWVESAASSSSPAFRIAVAGSVITGGAGLGSALPSTVLTNTNETYGSDVITVSTYTRTLTLFKGQQVGIWARPGVGVPVDHPPNLTVFGNRRLVWRNVRLATTTTVVLSGEQTIDGELTSGDRVLVRNQGDPAENGVYVTGAGAWTRATDSDTSAELINAAVYVTDGDTNAETAWRQTQDDVEIGVTSNNWVFVQPNDERIRAYPGTTVDNHFNVTAHTTFKKTRTTGFLLHDTAAAILKHYGLGSPNPFYSEELGSDKTVARQYNQNGCSWAYGLSKGLQLRGFSLNQKQFSMSFTEWWQGADPILNLGLGYEHVDGEIITPVVAVVEDLEFWSNAVGVNFGSWTFTSPNVPHTSANGSGGVTGYAKGDCTTAGGETYEFTFELEIYDTGSSGEITEVTVAILDSLDNELATAVFNYVVAGVKTEVFSLVPSGDGVSVGLRITNNTPFDTKSYQLNVFEATDSPDPIIIEEEDRIRVEKREYFYDPEPSILLSNIENIERSYDTEKIFKKVIIGYREWKTEDISGIDDPQTKHTYATQLKKIGEEIEVLSEFIGASLAIEQTRRQSIDRTTDYQYDDSTFIIALNPDYESDSSPDNFYPELDEKFVTINNLLNSATRYNIRITPGRNFLRHQNWFNIGLQDYVGTLYKFTRGEGNYDLQSQMVEQSPVSCDDEFDGDLLSEGQNFRVTNDSIHSVYYYTISEYPLSIDEYVIIRDNRRKAIGISQTDYDHAILFIDELTYEPAKALATFTGWTKERLDLLVIESDAPTQDCTQSSTFVCPDGTLTDELGEPLTDEFGDCLTPEPPGGCAIVMYTNDTDVEYTDLTDVVYEC